MKIFKLILTYLIKLTIIVLFTVLILKAMDFLLKIIGIPVRLNANRIIFMFIAGAIGLYLVIKYKK
jgi:hypothetical protein